MTESHNIVRVTSKEPLLNVRAYFQDFSLVAKEFSYEEHHYESVYLQFGDFHEILGRSTCVVYEGYIKVIVEPAMHPALYFKANEVNIEVLQHEVL